MPPARRAKRKAAVPGDVASKRSRAMHERASLDNIRKRLLYESTALAAEHDDTHDADPPSLPVADAGRSEKGKT